MGLSSVPIAEHALLSDRHSAALVTTSGAVDWLCFPRFDSASVFAAILDDDAGHWSIRPSGEFTTTRAYVGESLVLRTVFETADGAVELVDAMDLGPAVDPHRLGERAPHTLLRGLQCTRGRVRVEMSFAPRPEYGLVVPVMSLIDGGVRAASGGFTFTSPVTLHCADGTGRATVELAVGQRLYFALRYTTLGGPVFGFVTAAAAQADPGGPLQIMFGIGGEQDLSERELTHLSGWRDSRPVRIGNGAWSQPQLDVYGELLDAAYRLREQLGELEPATRTFLAGLADAAAARWEQTDHGIWEVRGEPRHFVYSKLMCWLALDRAVAMAEQLDAGERAERWAAEATRIRAVILDRGWNEDLGAFTQTLDGAELDASALMIPIVGFLPADDRRVRATVDAVAARLTDERGLVYRYHSATGVDGLPGGEGTFLLCTFWLARALAMAGRIAEAREVFQRAVAYVSDVGLLAEQIDPATGEQLGNTPQAFSHIGLINAAWSIQQAEQQAKRQSTGLAAT